MSVNWYQTNEGILHERAEGVDLLNPSSHLAKQAAYMRFFAERTAHFAGLRRGLSYDIPEFMSVVSKPNKKKREPTES